MDKTKIMKVIFDCVESLNLSLVEGEKILLDPDTTLFGGGSSLDSMGLLNLLMDAEEKLEDKEIFITILDDHALSQKRSPFRSIAALTEYLYEKINNES